MKRLILAALSALLGFSMVAPALADGPAVTASAVLLDPNTNSYRGSLLEHCDGKAATMRVILAKPETLSTTDFLAVQVASVYTPAIRFASASGQPEIVGFDGTSAIGCVKPGTGLSLVYSPGGPLGSLLIVVGKGTMAKPAP